METLVPFIPTEAERQHSLAQQYLKSAGYLATANLQRDRGWDVQEVNTVRAIPLIDLDPKRIIPERYLPRDGNPEFIFLQKTLLAANPDNIRQFDSNQYMGNPFQSFFNVLSQMTATGISVEAIMDALWRNPDANLIGTEHPTSDSEDDNDKDNAESDLISDTLSSEALRDFLNEYSRYIETARYSETDADKICLWVQRSIQFNIVDVGQRVQATKVCGHWLVIS